MLTIILTILKAIGITVLTILGLVLMMIFVILFVPLRYNADGFYNEDYKLYAKVSWLLHILIFQACLEKNEKFHASVKVFGITVFDNLKPEKKTAKTKKKEHTTPEIQAAQIKEPFSKQDAFMNNTADFETDIIIKETKKQENSNIVKSEDKINKSKFSKNKFYKIKKNVQKIHSAFMNIQYTIQNIYAKIKEVISNISYYISLLHSEQTQQAFRVCKKRLGKVVHNLKPKIYNINLHIGLEEPDTLGQILGIWGMLYPIHQGNIKVDAEFDKKIFECDFFIKGKITIWTCLWNICVIIFDENIKYLRKCLKREED